MRREDTTVEMRPKAVFRYAPPVVTVFFVINAIVSGELRISVLAMFSAIESVAAWRDYARLEDGVIYQRRWFGWHEPFLVGEVMMASFHYRWWANRPERQLELSTRSADRVLVVSWWSEWKPFVRQVVELLSTSTPTGRSWNIAVDDKTRRRLDFL